jgi:hypothetical protein
MVERWMLFTCERKSDVWVNHVHENQMILYHVFDELASTFLNSFNEN